MDGSLMNPIATSSTLHGRHNVDFDDLSRCKIETKKELYLFVFYLTIFTTILNRVFPRISKLELNSRVPRAISKRRSVVQFSMHKNRTVYRPSTVRRTRRRRLVNNGFISTNNLRVAYKRVQKWYANCLFKVQIKKSQV